MKMTISETLFKDMFRQYDRAGHFSYEALSLIFNYFEKVDEDMELDVIAICCNVSEMNYEEAVEEYGIEYDPEYDNLENIVIDYLNENTLVIGTTSLDTIVFFNF